MDKPKILTATEASRAFSDLLHRVCYGGESFIIKKGNRLMARITPVGVIEEAIPADPVTITAVESENQIPLPPELIPQIAAQAELTQEEAEYYQTVVEQLRKTAFEPCD